PLLTRLLPGARARRDLHSFPTRRSSDLASPPPTPATPTARRPTPRPRAASWCCRAASTESTPASSPTSSSARTTRTRAPTTVRRSEEHTSELQSRENLVCRLLLEKKNPP